MAMIFLLINYLPDFFINQLIRRGRRALINGWAAARQLRHTELRRVDRPAREQVRSTLISVL
jgi:preprotein translocase subunit SecE